jgi:transaldolase/glucose-6-phosphate isomerase
MGARPETTFTIRPLAPADVGALEAMYEGFEPRGAGLGLPPASREKTRQWLKQVTARSHNLVAALGARLIGHAILADSAPGEAELAVFVRQEHRRQGLGTLLAQAAVALAREKGYRRLWAAGSPANEAALRMVRRCGFARRAGAAGGDHEMELYLGPRGTTMEALNPLSYTLPGDLPGLVAAAIDDWRKHDKLRRLWQRDPTVWTNTDEAGWLGWLEIVERQLGALDRLEALARDVRQAGFTHALLLGMGGSSLCPEVLRMTFGRIEGYPELLVLDSTDPAQVRSFERRVALEATLFIVSSKSGTTLEPTLFKRYFFERLRDAVGPEQAARQFMAITDPGTELDEEARAAGFWRIFYGVPDIGGRFSALSDFGMAPAAVMGLDTKRLLESAGRMVAVCRPEAPIETNPGVVLGAILGTLAGAGRDKLTLVTSPGIRGFGAWLEQLVAESTGKDEKAIIPVDQEPLGSPELYGSDRLFVYLRLETAPDGAQDAAVAALEQAGQPVIRIRVADPYELGQEFFRWELATAVAGSILGINPFNQPDVVFSKTETKKLTSYFERTGSLPAEAPMLEEGGLKLYADPADAPGLLAGGATLTACLRTLLGRLGEGDYFAVLAYLEMRPDYEEILQAIRTRVRDRRRVATCLGFGPRYLHSTGQAYKAGPNTGVFLQITCDDANDLAVPGLPYSFGVVKAAQARGDFQVLVDRGRRALRVHLSADVRSGLERLRQAIEEALH